MPAIFIVDIEEGDEGIGSRTEEREGEGEGDVGARVLGGLDVVHRAEQNVEDAGGAHPVRKGHVILAVVRQVRLCVGAGAWVCVCVCEGIEGDERRRSRRGRGCVRMCGMT